MSTMAKEDRIDRLMNLLADVADNGLPDGPPNSYDSGDPYVTITLPGWQYRQIVEAVDLWWGDGLPTRWQQWQP